MGGVCGLGGVVANSSSDEETSASCGEKKQKQQFKTLQSVGKRQSKKTVASETMIGYGGVPSADSERSALPDNAKSGTVKQSQIGTFFSTSCTSKSGKSSEVFDMAGTRASTSKTTIAGTLLRVSVRESRIEILAFEVANTIVKGSNLMNSISEPSMRHLKEVVLRSKGVHHLISDDHNHLLVLVEADIREELTEFSAEVARFGNRCIDIRWHNLDHHFSKLESELTPLKHAKEAAISKMQYLIMLSHRTTELYINMRALNKFEQDYRRDCLWYTQGGEKLTALQSITLNVLWKALENQRNDVINLKKKSLWCKKLEDIVEKLADVVHFMHFEINTVFLKKCGDESAKAVSNLRQTLGPTGLALHYANVIVQINNLALLSPSIPDEARDALYQALPLSIKSALQTKLQSSNCRDKRTVAQIRSEMDTTLQWLKPVADSTTRLYHNNGTFGEWAMKGTKDLDSDGMCRPRQDYQYTPGVIPGQNSANAKVNKIETLYHADKERTEGYILNLVLDLHHLVCKSRAGLAAGINHKSSNGFVRSRISR